MGVSTIPLHAIRNTQPDKITLVPETLICTDQTLPCGLQDIDGQTTAGPEQDNSTHEDATDSDNTTLLPETPKAAAHALRADCVLTGQTSSTTGQGGQGG